MRSAQYGRPHLGRCVQRHFPGLEGCAVDVLHTLDRLCSGRSDCSVDVFRTFGSLEPCPEIKSFLKADFICVPGTPACYIFSYGMILGLLLLLLLMWTPSLTLWSLSTCRRTLSSLSEPLLSILLSYFAIFVSSYLSINYSISELFSSSGEMMMMITALSTASGLYSVPATVNKLFCKVKSFKPFSP